MKAFVADAEDRLASVVFAQHDVRPTPEPASSI
jgi:hypothetical protein